jgi:hypothetical protein
VFLGRALELEPDCQEALYNLGNTFVLAGRLPEAERVLLQVIAGRPKWSYPQNSLGTVLLRQQRFSEAADAFRLAVSLAPGWFLPFHNLGLALLQLGQDEAAMAALRSAIQCQPDFADAHLNLAYLLLRHGRFEEGFREYEWRFQNGGFPAARTGRPQPMWDGQPLAGRTLLLCAEQGAGDMIQFIRFAQHLATRGMRILIECAPSLKRLFASCPGIAGAVSSKDPCPEADLQFPLISVPRVLSLYPEDLPGTIPYLTAPASGGKNLDALISAGNDFKVGIVWTGDPQNPLNAKRSLTPDDLAALARVPGVQLFSLQYQDAGVPTDRLTQLGIKSLGSALGDFASAAAAIEGLDLTITIDTATAHLAGALGKPVWTLLDHLPDWRWMTQRLDSPWYPTMRLYRQERPGDWTEVLKRVERDLFEARSRNGNHLS